LGEKAPVIVMLLRCVKKCIFTCIFLYAIIEVLTSERKEAMK